MQKIRIGWSKREISLDKPVHLYGQMHVRISEGILDPLYVTALCVDGGEGQDCVIFCACDIEAPQCGIITAVGREVHRRHPELPETAIILSGTHTHAAPSLSQVFESSPDGREIYSAEKTRDFFVQQAADAACEAYETRSEGGIAYGYGFAVVGQSRRVVYFDDVSQRNPNAISPNGHAVMYGKTNDPMFSHYEGGADHMVQSMFTFDAKNQLTGILVNVPCPSQICEHFVMQTADFWHDVRENVKRIYGPEVYVLNHCAAGGDTAPRQLHLTEAQRRRLRLKFGTDYTLTDSQSKHYVRPGEDRFRKCMAERKDLADRITAAVEDTYRWAKTDIQTTISVKHVFSVIDLPRRRITEQEKAMCEQTLRELQYPKAEEFSDMQEYCRVVTDLQSVEKRSRLALQRYEEQKTVSCIPMKFHVLQIGDVAFSTIRYELYTDFMHRLQARSPFVQTMVIQLAGDEDEFYLCTERAERNKGYSASPFCNIVSPEAGQIWVEESLKILHQMKQ